MHGQQVPAALIPPPTPRLPSDDCPGVVLSGQPDTEVSASRLLIRLEVTGSPDTSGSGE